MQKITSVKGLKTAIRQLESDQHHQAGLLKDQFNITARSLSPMNLLRTTLKEILSSPLIQLIGIEAIKSYGHRLIDLLFRGSSKDSGVTG